MTKLTSLFILLISLSSCASLVTKPHELPAPDKMSLHDNAKTGDYAIYATKKTGVVHRYEVFEVTDKDVTVRTRMFYTDPDYKDLAPKEWYYRLLDPGGKVLKAWAKTDDGEVFDTPVAKPDEIGSLEHIAKINKKAAKPVVTKAGSFNIDDIYAYIYRVDAGLVSTNSSILEYQSNEVPFEMVKREMVHSADVGAFLTSLEYIKEAGNSYLSGNYLNIYNKATSKDLDYQSTFELVEYGFAK